MSLKIAYITSTYPDYEKCGVGLYAGYVTKSLSELNHEVHVITTALPEIKNTHGKVIIHKVMRSWGMLELPRLLQTLMQIKPDVIHINHPTNIAGARNKFLVNLFPEINKTSFRWPLVSTLHEFENISWMGKTKILPLLLGSDRITVTNKKYKESMMKLLPESYHSRIDIVDIGSCSYQPESLVSETGSARSLERATQREKWGIKDEHKVLGFIGFITPPKGFLNLVRALKKLSLKDDSYRILALSSWNLTSPAYKKEITDEIERLGLTDKIIFTGFLEDHDLWQSLSAIDLCTFPFDYPIESRSSAAFRQALFKGLPVITYASDLNYNELGLKNGENIILSPFKDETEFVENIFKFFASGEKLARTLSSGAALLRSFMSYESIANQLSRVYSKVTS